jgi:CubicO group peptidase (beta-lactamase class C family)
LWVAGLWVAGSWASSAAVVAAPDGGLPPAAVAKPVVASPALADAKPETVTADVARVNAAGTTLTVPAGWTLSSDALGSRRVLEGPEKDIKVVIIEAPAKIPVGDAVKAAWASVDPSFARKIRGDLEQPAHGGWEAGRMYEYETAPAEHRQISATARRFGDSWFITLVNADRAAFERRGGQFRLIVTSLRPAKLARESFAGRKPHALDADRIKQITDFVESARATTGAPGVAIGLIQGGKVVFAGGFGVRELGKPEPVDADTLFMIGSETKALTTLLLAREVDLGKFKWESPVAQVYPPFKLGDPELTKQVQMRHLVCACTGMPRQDLELLFESQGVTAAKRLALLGTIRPTSKLGEVFQYSNIMASAAGFIAGHLLEPKRELGAAYEEAMRREIFAPLGMRTATLDLKRAHGGNHASPHGQDINERVTVVPDSVESMVIPNAPSGGVWASVNDLAHYVQMELAKLPDGKPFISEAALLARRVPQIATGENDSYGMGLGVNKSKGVTVVQHGGYVIGFHSHMFWIPEADTGGVIFSNSDSGQPVVAMFSRRVLEVLYDGELEAERDVAQIVKTMHQIRETERKRLALPADPAATAKLATRYRNASLGTLTVKKRGADTIFDVGEWQSAVASRKNVDGTQTFITTDAGAFRFQFLPGEQAGKPTLTLRDAQHEYLFVAE